MKSSTHGFKLMFFAAIFGALLSTAAAYAGEIQFLGGYPKLSDKNVMMQWSPVPGASEYKVYRAEGKAKPKVIGSPKVNRFIDKDVPSGKTYRYSVAAVVGGKETAKTPEWALTTVKEVKKVFIPLKTPKLVAAHIKEAPGNKYSVGIMWENAVGTDMVGVNVYRSKVKGKDFALIGSSSTDTFEDSDVQPGTTYYYAATTVDSQFNETKYSNEISASIPSLAQVKAEEKKAAEVQPTKMRPAKLLFRIPKESDLERHPEAAPKLCVDVAIDEAVGHMYVTSSTYGGVLVYNLDGDFQFGIRKDGVDGQDKFGNAMGVAIGQGGNIYVSDGAGSIVSIFDFTGKPLGTINTDETNIPMLKDIGVHARNDMISIAKNGYIYISDPQADTIHVYDSENKHVTDWTGGRTEEEKRKYHAKLLINGPAYSAILNNGDLVVMDTGQARYQVIDRNGKFRNFIGKYGQGAGEFYIPTGVAIDENGNIFAGMGQSPNIQAFTPDGKFLYALCNETKDGPLPIAMSDGIALGSKNRLYVVEGMMGRVSVFQLQDGLVDIVPTVK